jgi:GWxTD domain-containing protein
MRFRSLFVLLLISVLSTIAVFAGVSKKDIQNLPPRYRDWLTKEVNYIITEEERETFVHLAADADRDKFIDRFWAIRNPDPESPTNRYKEEIYERIAYANQYFGHEDGSPGWMTDMGRVYITLGPPKQRGKYLGFANVRPMEIWFYDNAHPALPPFFYVVFYQRESGGSFKLYSPYMDGPTKLVTGYQAESGRLPSWQVIDKEAGREVSRTILSLIPDEPVDINTADSTLGSDVMLSTIKGLANNPFTKDMLNERRRLLEDVTHRVILGDEFLDVLFVPLRDSAGNSNVHFLLRLKKPDDFAIAQANDGHFYYSAEVEVKVRSAEGKVIFAQNRTLSRSIDQDTVDRIKSKLFGYEGVLPLPPGKYKVEFLLTNKIKKTSFRAEKDVTVPVQPESELTLSEIIPFTSAAETQGSTQPFQAASVKFTPAVPDGLTLIQGENLDFFYQIGFRPKQGESAGSAKLTAEYAYGRMSMHDTKTITDEVDPRQFDASGSMISGKRIPTLELTPGQYRLSVTVSDPQTHEKAFASLGFRVLTSGGPPEAWDIVDPELESDSRDGTFEMQRALCYWTAGNTAAANLWIERAFTRNPNNEVVLTRFVDSLFNKQDFQRIATIYTRSGITPKSDEQTILHMAESFDKLNQTPKAVEILESAVSMKPQSGVLYLSLANYYQRLGNAQKASEMERKGRSLVNSAQVGS